MSAEPAARRSHEGFLSKRSPKAGGGWQKRWFVLDGPAATLSYFKEKDARTLFDELDADNSGFLDSGEVEALCRQMGKKLGKKELAKAMAEIDLDGNDEVSFPEFEAWWKANGGKAADKRKAAGVIELSAVRSVVAIGCDELELDSPGRVYRLLAEPGESVQWERLIRDCLAADAAEQRLRPAAVARHRAWVVKHEGGRRDKLFCVVDARGLHFFRRDKDAVTDSRGEVDLSPAQCTIGLTQLRFMPFVAAQHLRFSTSGGEMALECERLEMQAWVVAISEAIELGTGVRPPEAEEVEDAVLREAGSFELLPPPPIPWGAPEAYRCGAQHFNDRSRFHVHRWCATGA